MRILIISSLYEPYNKGGAEIIAANLAKGLTKRGHTVVVATTHDGKFESETMDGVEVRRYRIRNRYWHFNSNPSTPDRFLWHLWDAFNFSAKKDIINATKEFNPDLAVSHNLTGFSVSTWTALQELGIPIVQVLHDYYTLCPRSSLFKNGAVCNVRCVSCHAFRIAHPYLSRKITAVAAVSDCVLNIHKKFEMFDAVPIKRVIHNARSITALSHKRERKLGELVFGYIGAISQEKGVDLLIETFRKYSMHYQNSRLIIAGEGEAEYVQQLKNEALDSPIVFLGRVKPEEFYGQLDVCVVPSVWEEPLGMVAFEALANGVPVIGSSRGGIPEMVQHRYNGLIFSPDDTDGLFDSLVEVTQTPELLFQLANTSSESVGYFTDEERMLDEHESLYREVVRFHQTKSNTSKTYGTS